MAREKLVAIWLIAHTVLNNHELLGHRPNGKRRSVITKYGTKSTNQSFLGYQSGSDVHDDLLLVLRQGRLASRFGYYHLHGVRDIIALGADRSAGQARGLRVSFTLRMVSSIPFSGWSLGHCLARLCYGLPVAGRQYARGRCHTHWRMGIKQIRNY